MKSDSTTIIAYKGFDKDLKCKDFQYEVGKEYEESEIKICERGFHACESPVEVWDYYGPHNSRFCQVEQSGDIQREDNTTKVCSSKIKIKAELKLEDIIRLGIEWIRERCTPDNSDSAQIGSSGDSAQIGSSGDYAQIGSSGHYAQIGSSGHSAKIESSGQDSVICCAGHNAIVRAKQGSWITLAEWVYDPNKERSVPKCVKTEFVDGERIKADTWYKLVDGEFTEQ